MKIKKEIVLIMSLVFALLLAACGEKESSGDADLDDWDGYVDEIKKNWN